MTGRDHGFTLHELMVALAVFAVFSAVAFGLGTQAHREHDWTKAYREDLRSCRSAMRALEADARAGRRILPAGSSVVVRGPAGDVEYRHEDGELDMTPGDGIWP